VTARRRVTATSESIHARHILQPGHPRFPRVSVLALSTQTLFVHDQIRQLLGRYSDWSNVSIKEEYELMRVLRSSKRTVLPNITSFFVEIDEFA